MPCWYFDRKDLRHTVSIQAGLTYEQETQYRREGARFILQVGNKMGLRYETMATGVVYFHRFYMVHTFQEFPRHVTACCCLFLAGKVEETPKKCKDIMKTAKSLMNEITWAEFGLDPREEVMTLERILLQTIKFDFIVEHPYTYLLKYAKCLKGDNKKLNNMVQMAWTFVNDSLCTTLSLQWEPEIIAIALMYLAGKLSKFEVVDWANRSPKHSRWWDLYVEGISMELLEDICHQVLDLYSSNKADAKSMESVKDAQEKGKKSDTSKKSSTSTTTPSKSTTPVKTAPPAAKKAKKEEVKESPAKTEPATTPTTTQSSYQLPYNYNYPSNFPPPVNSSSTSAAPQPPPRYPYQYPSSGNQVPASTSSAVGPSYPPPTHFPPSTTPNAPPQPPSTLYSTPPPAPSSRMPYQPPSGASASQYPNGPPPPSHYPQGHNSWSSSSGGSGNSYPPHPPSQHGSHPPLHGSHPPPLHGSHPPPPPHGSHPPPPHGSHPPPPPHGSHPPPPHGSHPSHQPRGSHPLPHHGSHHGSHGLPPPSGHSYSHSSYSGSRPYYSQ